MTQLTKGPERVCRIVNVASGTLLDAAVNSDSNVYAVIGSPEEIAAIKRWKVIPLGVGWALEAIQVDTKATEPRYLAPTASGSGLLSLSQFPAVWDLERTAEHNYESDQYSRPPNMEEEWVCVIRYPFGLGSQNKVLDLDSYGSKDPGTKIRFQSFREPPRRQPCQHWRFQFVPSAESISPPPYRASRTVEAHTKVITTIETTTVTHTNVIPPRGNATTKSHTFRNSTTSTAYFKPDGSIENEIL